MIVDRK